MTTPGVSDRLDEPLSAVQSERVERALRQAAQLEGESLRSDSGFEASLLRRLGEADHLNPVDAGLPAAAESAAASTPTRPLRGAGPWWVQPDAWMALSVGLLLAVGLWVSADLIGPLEWARWWAWGDLASTSPADGDHAGEWVSVSTSAGGLVVAAWMAWFAWQATGWWTGGDVQEE